MVDFEWYRSFISIYKHNSVSGAAKSRFMTQPAMSQHLAALEAEVGESLFTRTSRKMKPTEKGKELYTLLAPLIESLEETTIGFKASSTPALPVIRIGTAPEIFRGSFLPNMEELELKVIAQFGTAAAVLEFLKEDKSDVVITSQKYETAGIEHVKILEEKFLVVTHPNLEIPDFENRDEFEKWLCHQKWLSYGLDLPIIRRFWRELFKRRPQLQPAHILLDLHMILRSIEQNYGISVLPNYMLDRPLADGTIKVPFPEHYVTNEIYVAYKIKNKSDPALQRTIQFIKDHV
ncbi:LysR family transcriptional regulator [Fictibacillus fluitans]|uniref:LysR family transcriptional regulator n=1 Tax=Fictibacillus fluitans TaxID=3058422 RepID=A0ABT8HYL6_9BACL|nr:LysR family transcriptional regulator [Fictibacillus sp. NE201]MDN4525868.1 LysR family transcriptional regulator [Fictibacillus sp. NE201]